MRTDRITALRFMSNIIASDIKDSHNITTARDMPAEIMCYLFDLLGFLRNGKQFENGLIPIYMEKCHLQGFIVLLQLSLFHL
jgi:hypothetical protein